MVAVGESRPIRYRDSCRAVIQRRRKAGDLSHVKAERGDPHHGAVDDGQGVAHVVQVGVGVVRQGQHPADGLVQLHALVGQIDLIDQLVDPLEVHDIPGPHEDHRIGRHGQALEPQVKLAVQRLHRFRPQQVVDVGRLVRIDVQVDAEIRHLRHAQLGGEVLINRTPGLHPGLDRDARIGENAVGQVNRSGRERDFQNPDGR